MTVLTHEDMGYDASARHPDWHIAEAKALEERARGHRETAAYMERKLREANERRRIENAPPVDRSAVQLTDGAPVPEDASHLTIKPDGQQEGYVVLSAAERAKGFVRPYRDAYRHEACKAITTMGRSIAETYARDPTFYGGTYCSTCRQHFPVGEKGEFTWYEMDGRDGPKVGT